MDETILLAINQGWAHPWLDVFFAWLSRRDLFAFPLLLVLLWLYQRRWGADGIKFWALLIVIIATGDLLGNILKHLIEQPRPCHALHTLVRLTSACYDSRGGMPSNHAVNFFSAATFLAVVLRERMGSLWLFVVAALVGLSRIYLGKHYPSQVLTGAIMGTFWGALGAWVALKYKPFMQRIRPSKGAP